MKRALKIYGCSLLVLSGLAITAVIKPWPLVWCIGFPIAYAGALGIMKEFKRL